MEWNVLFFFNSVLLGVALAIDAFSVSLANGLGEPAMKRKKMCGIAGVFAFFQAFEKFIPWIALGLLLFLGGKMLLEARKGEEEGDEKTGLGIAALLVQGVATSIDALSVGFTIASYDLCMALVCALIIAVVTFFISISGLVMGKKFGTNMSREASVLGGVILILIGLEIFITGVF